MHGHFPHQKRADQELTPDLPYCDLWTIIHSYPLFYLAKATARFSRMTITLIWPGYCMVS